MEIRRNGIRFRVDLTEGIDLSLYLFGAFQPQILTSPYYRLKPDAVVLDVGANIGSMTLLFANYCPQGKVFAFEPTHYAFQKLQANLERNPLLAQRVVAVNTFVSDRVSDHPGLQVCSSWKLNGDSPCHALHGGIVMSSDKVASTTLDHFLAETELQRVDLIKIDTDGFEYDVLEGARHLIEMFRPYIIFEVGTYLLLERQMTFETFLTFFESRDYRLRDIQNGAMIHRKNFKRRIPLKTAIDVLAFPADRRDYLSGTAAV
ncbi:MAG: FkbM family methyltransferase [Chitinispirillaceae bacterium]|nr:FkbM family methyltransferase [Chitinispirillaceae bacterium]